MVRRDDDECAFEQSPAIHLFEDASEPIIERADRSAVEVSHPRESLRRDRPARRACSPDRREGLIVANILHRPKPREQGEIVVRPRGQIRRVTFDEVDEPEEGL